MGQPFTKPQPILDQGLLASGEKSSTGSKILGIWIAANLVVTTLLTGTLFTPSLSLSEALSMIALGTFLGALVLVGIGSIGTRTGYATMDITKLSFGSLGSKLPASGNIVVLMGWSWVQAMLAGITVDSLIYGATGFTAPVVWSVVCEVIVVVLALFGHTAIAKAEPWFALVILFCMAFLLWRCFQDISLSSYLAETGTRVPYTLGLTFDAVFATAISWTVLSADFNRFGINTVRTAVGSFVGYSLSTILSMSLGAVLALFIFLQTGAEPAFDPVPLVESFGPIFATSVFLSVMATNSMVVYGMVNSVMSLSKRAKENYRWTACILGVVSIFGATQISLLNYFTNFLLLIGAFFVPIFAVMICDYYLMHRGEYKPHSSIDKSFRWDSLLSWGIGCSTAWVCMNFWVSPIGATLTSFIVTCFVFIVLSSLPKMFVQKFR